MTEHDKTQTYPNIHPEFDMNYFGYREKEIIERLAKEWYITSGRRLFLARSTYDYFLMKPVKIFSEMFNIERELIVVFSPYPQFQPRTLDAFDEAQNQLSELRVESVCRVLISDDHEIGQKVSDLLKTDPERPIVIPFTYSELQSRYDDFFIKNRFREHFYTRDLFAFLSPLRKDLYFFGRSELLQEIINKHRAGEHTGLFGLRKSGKTSIIYAIERHLKAYGGAFVSLDCESPSVHGLRWYELLEKLVVKYKEALNSNYGIKTGDRYTEKSAADSFFEDILSIHRSKKLQPVLILFDEVERISPNTGTSPHWRNGEDFVLFWQTLRGFFQRNQGVFTYMLVGTNPNCVELSMIAGHENPLFGSIPSQYVPCFSVSQTREMVSKLGLYMGLRFDEILYAKLVEDFGGHPFLIRQFCSEIHKASSGDRPVLVDRPLYRRVMRGFKSTVFGYLDMIVSVLRDWYPDEYDMLRILAQDDQTAFAGFAGDNVRYTKHLVGYGLVTQGDSGFNFNIESLRDYLNSVHQYERLNLSEDEKVNEVSARRNRIEKMLRVVIRNILQSKYGRKKASEAVLNAVPEGRRKKIGDGDVDVLLARDSSPLFLLELISIIKREWEAFQNVFEIEKNNVIIMLEEINASGRPDAHAKYINEDEFTQLRLYFKKLEKVLENWTT